LQRESRVRRSRAARSSVGSPNLRRHDEHSYTARPCKVVPDRIYLHFRTAVQAIVVVRVTREWRFFASAHAHGAAVGCRIEWRFKPLRCGYESSPGDANPDGVLRRRRVHSVAGGCTPLHGAAMLRWLIQESGLATRESRRFHQLRACVSAPAWLTLIRMRENSGRRFMSAPKCAARSRPHCRQRQRPSP
jgi:hypothetical protein